jgi:tetratricopeptide (TPR) repeat protein
LACICLLSTYASAQAKPSSSTFQSLSTQAAQARDADRLQDAIRLYQRALALRPRWQEGWWSLGTIEYDLDHYASAARDFQKVIALNPKNGTAHAMFGLCEFELGKDAVALKNLLAADRLGITNNDDLRRVSLYHLGLLQLRARRFGDAHETLFQLAKARVRTKELFIALGQAALLIDPRQSPGTTAEGIAERAGEAEALSATKDFDQAKQIYTSLIAGYPGYPNLHFAYGRMLLEAHETDSAIQEFQRELNRDPNDVNAMLEIASVRYQVDSQDGLKYAEEAVKLAPEIPFGHYLLGLLRLDTGNAAGAIPELERAQKSFPAESKVYFSLGKAYARVGRKADAARARAEFLRLDKQPSSEPGSNVYGEQAPGLSKSQMRTANQGNSAQ